jgi:hypothetical protein
MSGVARRERRVRRNAANGPNAPRMREGFETEVDKDGWRN